jgi:hypothetical protein
MTTFTTRVGLLLTLALVASTLWAGAADVPPRLLDAYLQVQRALVSDELPAAVADARIVAAEAAKAGAPAEKIHASADKVASASTLAAAREAFGELSGALLAYSDGKSPRADVKVAYCKMANKPWLQKGDTIQNPYFGKAMAECGELKK